jgi:putative transposase
VDNESTVRKGYHCAWQIHYHIAFRSSTGNLILDEEVVQIIKETVLGISAQRNDMRWTIESMGMDKNRIHILCDAHPKLPPGRIVQIFKSITAREIFSRKPSVKKQLWVVNSGLTATM